MIKELISSAQKFYTWALTTQLHQTVFVFHFINKSILFYDIKVNSAPGILSFVKAERRNWDTKVNSSALQKMWLP